MKTGFFPVRITTQGKPCSGPVRDCSEGKGKNIKKPCSLRFSLHKFVHLKSFWTLFKNVHCQGLCSLRPCISRPYCIIYLLHLPNLTLLSNHLYYHNFSLSTMWPKLSISRFHDNTMYMIPHAVETLVSIFY